MSLVNDLPEVVSSPLYMFTDDIKMFREITDNADHHQLQTDIDNLVAWSAVWRLAFNPAKCKIMTLGREQVAPCYTTTHGNTVVHIEKAVLNETWVLQSTVDYTLWNTCTLQRRKQME